MINKDLTKYPRVNYLFKYIKNIIRPGEEHIKIDFESDSKKEYEYYKKLGLKTAMGGDGSMYFTNHESDGLDPSSYGSWTTCYVDDLTNDSLDRLEYFLENKIFKPFRMKTWFKEDWIMYGLKNFNKEEDK